MAVTPFEYGGPSHSANCFYFSSIKMQLLLKLFSIIPVTFNRLDQARPNNFLKVLHWLEALYTVQCHVLAETDFRLTPGTKYKSVCTACKHAEESLYSMNKYKASYDWLRQADVSLGLCPTDETLYLQNTKLCLNG